MQLRELHSREIPHQTWFRFFSGTRHGALITCATRASQNEHKSVALPTWCTALAKEIGGRFILVVSKRHFASVNEITHRNIPSYGPSNASVTGISTLQLFEVE